MKGQESLRIRARRAWPRAVAWFFLMCGSAAAADTPWSWLAADTVAGARMTQTLNALWAMTPKEAGQAARALGQTAEGAAGDMRRAAHLLQAVAFERADAMGSAKTGYKQVAEGDQSTPYAVTADLRLRLLNAANAVEREAVYQAIVDDPRFQDASARNPRGWILEDNHWTDELRPAALRALMTPRNDWLSVRLFHYLESVSILPRPYSYLFILLFVSLAVKVLQLPWLVRGARTAQAMQRLKPKMAEIQSLPEGERAEAVVRLFRENNLDMKAGCLFLFVDLVFFVWILIVLAAFAPQLALDGARFLWIPDITRYNGGIVPLFVVVSLLAPLVGGAQLGQTPGQIIGGGVFVCLVVWPLAWYFGWPAYVFILWIGLALLGLVIQLPMRAYFKAAG